MSYLVGSTGFRVQGLQQLQHTGSVAVAHSEACESFQTRNLTSVPCTARQILNTGPPRKPYSIFFLNFHNCIYFWLCWVFVAVQAFLQLWQSAALLQLQCAGFSLQWLLLLGSTGSRALRLQQLQHMGSVVVAPRLQSTGLVAPWMWDLSRPGIEPMSPELAGEFFSTEPQGKPPNILNNFQQLYSSLISKRDNDFPCSFLNFHWSIFLQSPFLKNLFHFVI